jgi:hypothetical protein
MVRSGLWVRVPKDASAPLPENGSFPSLHGSLVSTHGLCITTFGYAYPKIVLWFSVYALDFSARRPLIGPRARERLFSSQRAG